MTSGKKKKKKLTRDDDDVTSTVAGTVPYALTVLRYCARGGRVLAADHVADPSGWPLSTDDFFTGSPDAPGSWVERAPRHHRRQLQAPRRLDVLLPQRLTVVRLLLVLLVLLVLLLVVVPLHRDDVVDALAPAAAARA